MENDQFVVIAAVMTVLVVIATCFFLLDADLRADVDPEGFFATGDHAATGDAFPGAGVRLVVVDAANGRLLGRMDPHTSSPTFWTKAADGTLTPRALRARPSDAPLRASVVAAALASLAARPRSETLSTFAECCGAAPERPEPLPPGDAPERWTARRPASPAAAGLSLESWAPRDCVFVRFRSVEAAYRFADEVDRLAGALLVSEADDARDYGTLRLVLHDLLLPTIWRTNPGAARGVGEVGLVVAPPFVRGRLRAAAVLRIVDPDLHRMQTAAGIAEESTPGHLWRPEDDPFPAERGRINFRQIPPGAPDVEIVATDRALGERVASRASSALDGDEDWRRARAASLGPDSRPAADEAAFLWNPFAAHDDLRALVPATVQSAVRELREATGLNWLAERWIGHAQESSRLDLHARGPSALASIVALRIATDAKGATFDVSCRDDGTARAFARALAALPSADAAAERACRRNLEDLAPLALVENPQDDVAERNFVVLGWKPVCPCGGTYSVHPVTREATCSVHGSAASPRKGAFAPPPVSNVRAEGAELTFRLAVDWNRQ